MRRLALRAAVFSALALAAACAGAPPNPPAPPPAPSASVAPAPPPPPASASASAVSSAPPVASAEPPPETPKEPEKPAACPAGMLLVDGDYCTDLEMKCLSSHYAKQNKKTICHEFEYPTKCVGPKEHKRFCIDEYEYPNKKGERPLVMKNFVEAQQICASEGKRICTETEWTTACEGPEYKPYPYGYKRDSNKCRGDREYKFPDLKATHGKNKEKARKELERLWDGVPSGSQPDCVSDYGVKDMPGNADELASSEKMSSPYDNVTTGGPWLDGVRNQCRPKIYTHNEGFSYYYLSFRCCAEADGKPTDPRSPKQIARHQKWQEKPVSKEPLF